jgi:hypothetical protein
VVGVARASSFAQHPGRFSAVGSPFRDDKKTKRKRRDDSDEEVSSGDEPLRFAPHRERPTKRAKIGPSSGSEAEGEENKPGEETATSGAMEDLEKRAASCTFQALDTPPREGSSVVLKRYTGKEKFGAPGQQELPVALARPVAFRAAALQSSSAPQP